MHKMCLAGGTVFLQDKGLTDLPSVAVNELKLPALNRALARRRGNEPPCGGGVNGRRGAGQIRPNQHGRPAAHFRRELQPANLHAGEWLHH